MYGVKLLQYIQRNKEELLAEPKRECKNNVYQGFLS